MFTRHLHLRDSPTLHGSVDSAEQVLPVFVLDDAILGSACLAPNRASFLVDALGDLDESLKQRVTGGSCRAIVRAGRQHRMRQPLRRLDRLSDLVELVEQEAARCSAAP